MNAYIVECAKRFSAPKLFQWPIGVCEQVSSFTDLQGDKLPLEGRQQIRKCLSDNHGFWLRLDDFGCDSSWEYIVSKHPAFCGSLVKRLRKWCRLNAAGDNVAGYEGNQITSDTWGEVGSIIGEYQNEKVWYSFTDSLDWNAGDFGDGDSCFFESEGCRAFMPEQLTDNGCHAILFYKDKDMTRGIGRALIAPYKDPVTRQQDAVVINAYGFTRLKVARILSTVCGLEYRQVKPRNKGMWQGAFWINEGDGYVISDDVEKYDSGGRDNVDFDFEIESRQCHECGEGINENESHSVDGYHYCSDCVTCCELCESNFVGDGKLGHDDDGNDVTVCNYCYNNLTQCPCCDERYQV